MQVRLTKAGQKALGFDSGRRVVTVSDSRAFALMSGGFAAPDRGFMALFNGPLPEKELEMKKVEGPKREMAVSKKATKREKTVKTNLKKKATKREKTVKTNLKK